MSARQASGLAAGVAAALRCCGPQSQTAAHAWLLRPAGSLLNATPSTSTPVGSAPPAAALANPVGAVRGMAGGNPMGGFDPWSWFDYRKTIYPDVYDAQEGLLCRTYKAHGSVAERYEPPQPFTDWNLLADPELERKTKYWNKRLYTAFVLHRSVWKYSKSALQAKIADAYRSVNTALATGDLSLAEPFVSEQMLQRLGGEVARRGRNRVEWRLVGDGPDAAKGDVQLVHGSIVPNPMKQGKLHFAQWTARIASKQVVAVYDARGKLLAGDPHKELDVVDYWVFERPILKAAIVPRPGPMGAEWKLIDRLQL
ncbi:hypothetical protein HYH03_011844 [Edaphochlamys debaryana]|uniref:Large ribosomal subunit protein mL45 n=1 Tax=Edaphochlamys debaryana TaxID=47281 RepID=A0A835XRB9_9CHLO|nr:hypothetical protein HYH03_011844 [Edaphochlamys debaryana]|eukprot:KAG2489737.1 hypothetical protein HYH03_011844 [Edaphochlamys debaryana]